MTTIYQKIDPTLLREQRGTLFVLQLPKHKLSKRQVDHLKRLTNMVDAILDDLEGFPAPEQPLEDF